MMIAKYLPPNTATEKVQSSLAMPAETLALTAAQSAAFNLLRIPSPTIVPDNQFLRLSASIPQDPIEAYSPLNTPIRGRIILGNVGSPNTYTDAQGKQGNYETVELDCAIVTIGFNNNVVVTNIQGLGQSIKEFISNGDNDITITGIYNSTPGTAPIDFIQNMNAIFKCPFPIPVSNYYLNKQDIYNIVIMPGTEMGQEQGGYAYQTFTIKAISDVPMTQMLP